MLDITSTRNKLQNMLITLSSIEANRQRQIDYPNDKDFIENGNDFFTLFKEYLSDVTNMVDESNNGE